MVNKIRFFSCLKTEAEPASETPRFIKKLEDGQSPQKNIMLVITIMYLSML
jgi:hypothetical protein